MHQVGAYSQVHSRETVPTVGAGEWVKGLPPVVPAALLDPSVPALPLDTAPIPPIRDVPCWRRTADGLAQDG